MDIATQIHKYQKEPIDTSLSIFLALADKLISEFPHRLNKKTYLLIPNPKKELTEISYEYLLTNGSVIPVSLMLTISEIMQKFNVVAQKLGFTIISDMSEYHNDGELFNLLGDETINQGIMTEGTENITGVKVPLTMSVDNYTMQPFLPAVFKNDTANRGEDKYLIETNEQLQKIMALFELPESKKINLKNEFIVQEYIQGFENMNTSLRVLTSCTGEILASIFLLSTNQRPKKRVKKYGIDIFNPCEYLNDPSSPYYLNAKSIISNAAGGGKIIPLNSKINELSLDDKLVLLLHEIDIEDCTLPDEIIKQCELIASHWQSQKGIVLGIDFIYNTADNSWYYIEANRNPSVEGYKQFMNLNNYLKKDIKALMQFNALMNIVEKIMTKDQTLINTIKK